jgi:hypothetical protein
MRIRKLAYGQIDGVGSRATHGGNYGHVSGYILRHFEQYLIQTSVPRGCDRIHNPGILIAYGDGPGAVS